MLLNLLLALQQRHAPLDSLSLSFVPHCVFQSFFPLLLPLSLFLPLLRFFFFCSYFLFKKMSLIIFISLYLPSGLTLGFAEEVKCLVPSGRDLAKHLLADSPPCPPRCHYSWPMISRRRHAVTLDTRCDTVLTRTSPTYSPSLYVFFFFFLPPIFFLFFLQ